MQSPIPQEYYFDVTGNVAGLEEARIHAAIFVPTLPASASLPLLNALILYPGGSFNYAYWDLQVPGYPLEAYSFARYMARHGFLVVALEHLGTGQSSRPQDGKVLSVAMLAQANYAAGRQLYARLLAGTLLAELPPCEEVRMVAIAHSFGAMLLTFEQGEYGLYEAVVIQGWSNGNLHLLSLPGVDVSRIVASMWEDAGYTWLKREAFHTIFYRDVPEEVMKAEDANWTCCPLYPGVASSEPGVVAVQAAKIACPVLHVLGEFDASESPAREVAFYAAARNYGVTLYELPAAGHCHNTAKNRLRLWDFTRRWLASMSQPVQVGENDRR